MRADPPGSDPSTTGAKSRSPRRLVLWVTGVILVVIVALSAFALWPRGADEITTADAVEGFRDSGPPVPADASGASSPVVPRAGVYEYRASGSEQVSFGPLPPEDRPLPPTVTVVVGEPTEGDDGSTCFEWTLNLFRQHTESTTWCTATGDATDDADGGRTLRLAEHTKHQTIGALSPVLRLTCDPDELLVPGRGESEIACGLTVEGGPIQVDSQITATAATAAPSRIDVGGEAVEGTPLTVDYQVSGALRGTWSESYLLDENLLPLRIERTLDLVGPAKLREDSILELTSLSPAR